MAFADLKVRALTGFPIAGVFLVLIALAELTCTGKILLFGLGVALVILCCWEFLLTWRTALRSFSQPGPIECWATLGTLGIALLIPVLFLLPEAASLLDPLADCTRPIAEGSLLRGMVVALVLIGVGCAAAGRESRDAVSRSLAAALAAFTLIGLGGGALCGLAIDEGAPWGLLWLAFVVCINDISAYFSGAYFGGPKMCAHLSPGKTLSGSLGGLLGGVLTGLLVGLLVPSSKGPLELCVLAATVVIAAQAGDLLKSYLKRVAGVKDFGTLLPGHGGIFDRLDGVLAAAPLVLLWWY